MRIARKFCKFRYGEKAPAHERGGASEFGGILLVGDYVRRTDDIPAFDILRRYIDVG
jgi:hypothetical protein